MMCPIQNPAPEEFVEDQLSKYKVLVKQSPLGDAEGILRGGANAPR